MQSKKASKIKECKEKPNELNNKGFREPKDLSGKSPIHKAAALKNKFEKEQISKEVAIIPVDNELGKKENEDNVTQEAAVTGFEKKIDDVEIPVKDDELILRYKDSDNFLDAVFQFEQQKNITVPLDWDSDSDHFLVSVKKEISNEFQNFIKEKVDEMPDTREIYEIIAETQKVGKKQNMKTWLAHPNLTRREYFNIIGAKNDVLYYVG